MLKLIQLFDDDNFYKRIRLSNNKLNIGIEIKQTAAEQYFLSCDTTRKDTIYLINADTLKKYHEHIQQLVTSNVIIFTYINEQQVITNDFITETADFFLSYNYSTIDLYSIIKQSKKLLLGHTKTEFSRKLFSSSVSEIEQIINDSSQRIFWKNTDGRYIGCNILFANDFGLNDVKEIIGKTDNQLLDEKTALEFSAYDSEIIKYGETFEFSKEIKFKNKDKKTLNIKKYPHKKGGVIIGIIGKYELSKKHLEHQTNDLDYKKINEIISDNISELIFIKDTDCNYITINKLFANFLGIEKPSEILGKNDFDLFDSKTAKNYFAAEQKLLFDGISSTDILVNNNNTQEYILVKMPIMDEKNIITGIIGVAVPNNDIKKSNIKDLISKIGHDIRTPMNGIIGMAEVLLMDKLPSEQAQMVNIIKVSGLKLLSIIDDILMISRIEAVGCTCNSELFNLNKLMEYVSINFNKNISNNNISTINIDKNIPINLIGNKQQIRRITELILSELDSCFNNDNFLIEVRHFNNSESNNSQSKYNLRFKIGNQSHFADDIDAEGFEYVSNSELEIVKQYGAESLKLILADKLIQQTKGRLRIKNETGQCRIYLFDLMFSHKS